MPQSLDQQAGPRTSRTRGPTSPAPRSPRSAAIEFSVGVSIPPTTHQTFAKHAFDTLMLRRLIDTWVSQAHRHIRTASRKNKDAILLTSKVQTTQKIMHPRRPSLRTTVQVCPNDQEVTQGRFHPVQKLKDAPNPRFARKTPHASHYCLFPSALRHSART